MIRINNQHGVTMPELLIALVLTAILSGVIVSFMTDNIRGSTLQTAKAELLSDAHAGLNTTANDIRLSTQADINNRWQDAHAPNAPINLFSWQSNGSTLVLATPAEDTNGNIIFDDQLNYISAKNNKIYYVKDGTLYRRILAAPEDDNKAKTTCPSSQASSDCPADKAVLQNVTDFTVKYFNEQNQQVAPADARSIELSITLSKVLYGEDVHASYTTRMVFRNG